MFINRINVSGDNIPGKEREVQRPGGRYYLVSLRTTEEAKEAVEGTQSGRR